MKDVRIQLLGDPSDLDRLLPCIKNIADRVFEEERRFFLTSPDFEQCTDTTELLQAAQRLVRWINNAVVFDDPSSKGVTIAGASYIADNGRREPHSWVNTL